ncbi:cytochrome ubiquinol oxidase subunit I [Corynebacterium callunae]|uniref:cytochrome ubiquinol oxidase subunit I n=1 Tax=Corynebacterium callunae TaxID=1721 RepID=UPI001FFEF068|nr:cytochrome ubiquinol oxidase subunit I [Corynebacterium callunae]
MDVVDIARWQFGITTVYHFIFVPLTIGLAPLVALMQTFWQVTGKEHWYRATRFFGTVLLINFALGVATGIVQEFQFGMNWSEYSRFVGDVFGGPLALEGLVAFFLESVFLGLWIFGWGKIPGWLHTASIWIVAIATNVSAYFIIVSNSFMQHPVGAEYNPETGRAELVDFWALLTNSTALAAFPHAVAGAFLTGGTFVLGISGWWLIRAKVQAKKAGIPEEDRHSMHRPALWVGWWTTVLASVGLGLTGDAQAKLMFVQQPMKMASAESLCHTTTDPNFSILTIGTHNNCDSVIHLLELPFVLPFLAEGKFTGVTLQGVKDLQAQAEALYGPGNYSPNLFVTYWSFRAMIGLMLGSLAIAAIAWFLLRKKRTPQGKIARLFQIGSLAALPFPFLANSAGWVFTEMGRQPWVVHPNPDSAGDSRTEMIRMTVDMGVSDHATWQVWLTLIGFTILYLVLFVVWFWLIRRAVLLGPPAESGPTESDHTGPATPVGSDHPITPLRFSALTSENQEQK